MRRTPERKAPERRAAGRTAASDIHRTSDMVWVLDPSEPFAGPVKNGGTVIATVSPGCWGPMMTPDYPSGHEVTKPVAVEGAEVGDAVVISIKKITVLSRATTSGTDEPQEGHYIGSASIAATCPGCGTVNPATHLEGVGEDAIICDKCGTVVKPFRFGSTYTVLMDDARTVAVTVPPEVAAEIAGKAAEYSALPPRSRQYSANVFARGEMPGVVTPLRPMIGNIGTCPAVAVPSSSNAGDSAVSLVGAPHRYAIEAMDLPALTDGHMDVNEVVEGAVIIAPVKVKGAGIYVGDVHAMMGDGELAGHTADVSAEVVFEVQLLKRSETDLNLDGPILLPVSGDLPAIVKPRTLEVLTRAEAIAAEHGFPLEERSLPIQVIGTGRNINAATENGLQRMAKITDLPLPEVRNRCTITGQVEIGRLPGVVQISMLVPGSILRRIGLWDIVSKQYGVGN
ncbi:MAG: acetamidase/formamidase family protein [Bacillota bacterium]